MLSNSTSRVRTHTHTVAHGHTRSHTVAHGQTSYGGSDGCVGGRRAASPSTTDAAARDVHARLERIARGLVAGVRRARDGLACKEHTELKSELCARCMELGACKWCTSKRGEKSVCPCIPTHLHTGVHISPNMYIDIRKNTMVPRRAYK